MKHVRKALRIQDMLFQRGYRNVRYTEIIDMAHLHRKKGDPTWDDLKKYVQKVSEALGTDSFEGEYLAAIAADM